MSELLKRENFGLIIEETLERFLSVNGAAYTVRWLEKHPILQKLKFRKNHIWLCNIYTNAVFLPDSEKLVFEPLIREFSASLIWWRVIFQKIYVYLSFSKVFGPFLCHKALKIVPEVSASTKKIIIPGNHKIRVLDYNDMLCYSIMKSGYPDQFLKNELAIRIRMEELNITLPQIVSTDLVKNIVCEKIVIGTPLNRLKIIEQKNYLEIAVQMIEKIVSHTKKEINVSDYLQQLKIEIKKHVNVSTCISDDTKKSLLTIVEDLNSRVGDGLTKKFTVSITHGDFQPGNILCCNENAVLIDWEYAGERQCGFDLLVYLLKSRSPRGLAERMQKYLKGELKTDNCLTLIDSVLEKLKIEVSKDIIVFVFMLEELEIRVRENSFSFINTVDSGLRLFMDEILIFVNKAGKHG